MSKKLKSKVAAFLLVLQFLFSFVLPLQPLVSLVQAQENQAVTFSKNESSILVANSKASEFSYFFQANNAIHASKEQTANSALNLDLKSQSGEDETPFDVKRLLLKTDLNSYFLEIAENEVTVLKEYQADSLELNAEEENFLMNSWQTDSAIRMSTTSSDVVLNQEYRFPLNEEVRVTFTKLPSESSPLSIQEVQLSAAQQKALGTTASVAYDVTTTMKDGEFAFDLRLPSVSSENKDVSVKFAETISELASAKTAENELVVNDEGDVTVKNLDHMTIFVVVYPLHMAMNIVDVQRDSNSWFFYNDETDVVDNSLGSFVTGPAIAPHGSGSVQISVSGSQRRNLATYQFSGTVLSTITELGFSTYNPSAGNGGSTDRTAYLNFNVDFDGSDTWQRRLIFTPPAAQVQQDTWQAWDAINSGNALWHYSGTTWPVTGEPGSTAKTWNQILTDYPGVRMRVSDSWLGIRVGSPYPDGYTENIDDFVFGTAAGTTIYNFDPNPSVPVCIPSSGFDSFSLGSVNGQDSWSATGAFDQAIVDNIYGYSSFGCKALRISDAITSGSFGDQTFAKPEANGAGETEATIGSFSEGIRQNHFEAQFDIASATPTQHGGTKLSISPDRGDGSRMSYLRFEDNMGGIDVFFDDALNSGPAFSSTNWHETKIASGLPNDVPHTVKFVMDFVDGPSNDVVEIYIDGSWVHTGTSWENYYRYDAEAAAEQSPRIVKTLIFREGGTANLANSGEGFLIDNVLISSSGAPTGDITPPTVPINGLPHGISIPTNNFDFTWDSSIDDSLPITYEFQSSLNPAQVGGVLTTGLWHSGVLPTAMIHSSGAPDGTWYWQVRAMDALGNTSAWSDIWNVTLATTDVVPPAVPAGLKFFSQDRSQQFACGARVPLQVAIPDWDDIIGDPSFSHFEYTSFHPSGVIGLNEQVLTVSELNNSWMPPADGAYGFAVRSVDTAGNKSAWALSDKTLAGSCQIIYDTVAPTVDLVFATPGPSATGFQAVFGEDVNQADAENKANYFLNNWPGAGGSGDLVGDATISYNPGTRTATIQFTNPGWYISPEQEWGVQNIRDLAGNVQVINPYTERSTPMVDPTDPGVATSTPNPTNSLTQVWNWLTSTDVSGSGVKGYYQRIYDVTATSFISGWTWLGNVLGSTTNLTNGQWQIELKAEDNAGNQSGEVLSSVLNVDTVAPTATVSYSTTAPINGNVIATLVGQSEAITVTNNGSWLTRTFTDNGLFTFEFVDSAGNIGSAVATVNNIDRIAPVVAITAPTTSIVSGIVPIKGTVTDANPHHYYLVVRNSSNVTIAGPGTVNRSTSFTDETLFNWNTAALADGLYTIRLEARDSANNKNAGSVATKTVRIDRSAPVTTDDIADSNWHNSDVVVNLSCADSGSLCDKTYYNINGGSFIEGSSLTLSDEGEYVISYYSTDNAGNIESTKTATQTVKIDKTKPTSEITSPVNGGTNSVIYTNSWDGLIAGTATDSASGLARVNLSIQRTTDGKFWSSEDGWVDGTEGTVRVTAASTASWSYTLPAPAEDSYLITSHAVDNATNVENSYKLTIVFDKTIPEINLSISPVNPDGKNGWYNTAPTIILTMTDDKLTDYIQYQWESQTGPWNTYVSPIQPGSEGRHILYYRAIDKAGNSSAIGIKNLAWDKTELTEGPLKVDATPDRSGGPDAKVTWEAATDNVGIDHYKVTFDLLNGDADFSEDVASHVRELKTNRLKESGTWKITVIAYDGAGHEKSASDEIVVDKTAPAAPTLNLTGTGAGSVNLAWNKVDEADEYIILYGVNDGEYTYAARVGNVLSYTVQGLTAGSYYFVVRAEDGSGNQSANSNQVSTPSLLAAPGGGNEVAEGFTETPEVLGVNTAEQAKSEAQVAQNGEVQGANTSCNDLVNSLWWILLLAQFIGLFITEYKLGKKQKWLKLGLYALLAVAPFTLTHYFVSQSCFSNAFTSWMVRYYFVPVLATAMLAKVASYLLIEDEN